LFVPFFALYLKKSAKNVPKYAPDTKVHNLVIIFGLQYG